MNVLTEFNSSHTLKHKYTIQYNIHNTHSRTINRFKDKQTVRQEKGFSTSEQGWEREHTQESWIGLPVVRGLTTIWQVCVYACVLSVSHFQKHYCPHLNHSKHDRADRLIYGHLKHLLQSVWIILDNSTDQFPRNRETSTLPQNDFLWGISNDRAFQTMTRLKKCLENQQESITETMHSAPLCLYIFRSHTHSLLLYSIMLCLTWSIENNVFSVISCSEIAKLFLFILSISIPTWTCVFPLG